MSGCKPDGSNFTRDSKIFDDDAVNGVNELEGELGVDSKVVRITAKNREIRLLQVTSLHYELSSFFQTEARLSRRRKEWYGMLLVLDGMLLLLLPSLPSPELAPSLAPVGKLLVVG